jgi:hypothetical protein
MRHHTLLSWLLVLFLTGCSAPSTIVVPMPASAPRAPAAATVTPTPGPTAMATAPIRVFLRVVVTDQETEQPVVATLWIDDQEYGPAAALDVIVPFTGEFILKAQAPGYKEWEILIRGRFVRDKDMEVPVRLIPVGRSL